MRRFRFSLTSSICPAWPLASPSARSRQATSILHSSSASLFSTRSSARRSAPRCSSPSSACTGGFGRDGKLFLFCLVGFLVFLTFTLLLLLRVALSRTEETIDRSQAVVADIAADAINHTDRAPAALDAQMVFLRGRFHIAGIALQ